MKSIIKILLIIFNFNLLLACPVCYGAKEDPAVQAAQTGILFMLGVVGLVLSCFAIFMFNLSRKSKKV
tara:strand:- start:23004 stop:23207 length:204 start_codon:yes stop_codon:yes gene_type:complete